jgi:hypothetical protein
MVAEYARSGLDRQQICFNCHIPLENQQEDLVVGFRDKEMFKPILEPNPNFDQALQNEGVTCAVCHVREGRIVGTIETEDAPHAVTFDPEMSSGTRYCEQCHVVSGERWDTFYNMPPCGTGLTNVGAAHFLPTGTPDRHLTLELRLLDGNGKVLKEKVHVIRRYILWRPFIVDLKDTRLAYGKPGTFEFSFKPDRKNPPSALEVMVRYHLLDEKRRKRIGYENKEPIAYPIYRRKITL